MTGKLTIALAIALVFGQLQCVAWCTVSASDLTQLSEAGSHNVPPCHRHQTDSNKSSPASPCTHGVVSAGAASFSTAQASVAAPLVAILSVQPEMDPRALISGDESAVLITSPPGSGGPCSLVLRI
jgi:hypothetical protein